MTLERGQVVLVRFPFTDLTSAKQRPAVVVRSRSLLRSGKDVLVAAISGQRVDRPGPFDHVVEEWQSAGLLMPSVVRAGKLVTIHRDLVRRRLGVLSGADMAAVDALLQKVIGP